MTTFKLLDTLQPITFSDRRKILTPMSRICDVCGRGANVANWRSHAMNATKRKQEVNLQNKRIDGKKIKMCTKCMKTLARQTK